jgi:hypothetical protein
LWQITILNSSENYYLYLENSDFTIETRKRSNMMDDSIIEKMLPPKKSPREPPILLSKSRIV